MKTRRLAREVLIVAILGAPLLPSAAEWAGGSAAAEAKKYRAQATRSSPIAITHDDDYVWSVNPDNDSVSVFKVSERREHEGRRDQSGQRAVVRGHHA